MRALSRIAAAATIVGLAALGGILGWVQSHLIYFPTAELAASPADIGLDYESVGLVTADGVRIHGWFVPAAGERGVVLFFHGNAGNISHRLDTLRILNRLRLSTFIIDYRGFGRSEGSPDEQGTYADAAAAQRYLVEQRGIDAGEIVYFGRSLGGGVASWLALEQRPKLLVMESTFTSCPDLAADVYPFIPRALVGIHYDNLERIARVGVPLLVVHSRDDELIPVAHGRRLFEAAAEPKHFLEIHGTHGDGFYTSGQAYIEGLDAFFSEYL